VPLNIETITQLEEQLSRPSAEVIEEVAKIDGDILVLGAGGKMGPSLARMARRALDEAGSPHRVLAVSRFSDPRTRKELESNAVEAVACDLLDASAVAALPQAAAILFLAGTKFGTTDAAARTWAMNAYMPGLVAARWPGVPTVVFSSGNIYPFVSVESAGATEDTPPAPIGDYAWSVLARERVFEHFSIQNQTPTTLYRLNYATELRYGVLVDLSQKILADKGIDLSMGHVNVIWQGDANALALRCLSIAQTPPRILNVTGPYRLSIRALALRLGSHLGRDPIFVGTEQEHALLSDSSLASQLFGMPEVGIEDLCEAVARWVLAGGPTHDKPTHYEIRDGSF